MNKVRYGTVTAEARPANGAKGLLCRDASGSFFFRVREDDGSFTDYAIRHADLEITISPNEEATFYRIGDEHILDHSPATLGLTSE